MKNWVLSNYKTFILFVSAFISAEILHVNVIDYYFSEEAQFNLFLFVLSTWIIVYIIKKVGDWVFWVNSKLEDD